MGWAQIAYKKGFSRHTVFRSWHFRAVFSHQSSAGGSISLVQRGWFAKPSASVGIYVRHGTNTTGREFYKHFADSG